MKRFKVEDNRWDGKPDFYVTNSFFLGTYAGITEEKLNQGIEE